jgi:acetyl esterase/lipase
LEVENMADAAIVQTDSGPVRGTVTEEYRRFQGIPYAASTAGDHRWREPAPVEAWTEPRDATKPGNICAQQPSVYADVASLEEDCLFLNVTTPRWIGADRLRPVMVWIHGNGAVGAGSFFDARRLAITGDVIVVTINYRLGVFGVFGYPGLDGSGTFGLQDQRAALQWVQRNAAAFGGDPDNVTLFGESYGGLATSAHLTSPESQGLFHRAIIQSGFALMDLPAGALYPGVPAVEWLAGSRRLRLRRPVRRWLRSWVARIPPLRSSVYAEYRCRISLSLRALCRSGTAIASSPSCLPTRCRKADFTRCRSCPAAPVMNTGCSSDSSAYWLISR